MCSMFRVRSTCVLMDLLFEYECVWLRAFIAVGIERPGNEARYVLCLYTCIYSSKHVISKLDGGIGQD